jgi:DNA adenine methylase
MLSRLYPSPLRYPGGKNRVAKRIAELIPEFQEYREPFLGGGSVFLALATARPDARYRLNDLYPEVSNFWEVASKNLAPLISAVEELRRTHSEGASLYSYLRSLAPLDPVLRAAKFFVLNRITFSGTSDSGGYSQHAFEGRFTSSSIERLKSLEFLASLDLEVTNTDYAESLEAAGDGVFIYLDPPYITARQKLYGQNGNLHRTFDHPRFASEIMRCQHRWLVTYNDGESVSGLLPVSENINHLKWEQHYGMKSGLGASVPKGQELIIANYPINEAVFK